MLAAAPDAVLLIFVSTEPGCNIRLKEFGFIIALIFWKQEGNMVQKQVTVGINGFGRIGRLTARVMHQRKMLDRLKAVCDVDSAQTLAHLLKRDTVHGPMRARTVEAVDANIIVDGYEIPCLPAQKVPAEVAWGEERLGLVIEATGRFSDPAIATGHTANHVLITQPASVSQPDLTLVFGANDHLLDLGNQRVISLGSCTTNSIGMALRVLHSSFGIKSGWLETVHAYTADQRLQDAPHSDLRRARAAAENIVPTKTGAASAIGDVLPELAGKLDGGATRVPVADGSLSILILVVGKQVTVENVNEVLGHAAEGSPILGFSREPLVSSDVIGDPHSGIVDSLLTRVVGGNLVTVKMWYDNEWGFANRVVDFVKRAVLHVEGPERKGLVGCR